MGWRRRLRMLLCAPLLSPSAAAPLLTILPLLPGQEGPSPRPERPNTLAGVGLSYPICMDSDLYSSLPSSGTVAPEHHMVKRCTEIVERLAQPCTCKQHHPKPTMPASAASSVPVEHQWSQHSQHQVGKGHADVVLRPW